MRGITEPENWQQEIKEEIRKERKHARDLLKQGKYREVILYIDGIYGFFKGSPKEEYTKEEAKKAISSLL